MTVQNSKFRPLVKKLVCNPLFISFLINASVISILVKIGVFPEVVSHYDSAMKVFLTDTSTPPPPPRPMSDSTAALPEFNISTAHVSPVQISLPEEINQNSPPLLQIPPPPSWVPPPPAPIPISLSSGSHPAPPPQPSPGNIVGKSEKGSTGASGKPVPRSPSGEIKGAPFSRPSMIGGLDIPEKKLMVVMPSASGNHPGPIVMLPEQYRRSLISRAGPYLLGVKGRSRGYALNDDFVNEWISFAERTKPDAIYWLHWTIGSESATARQRLSEWIKSSGMKVYVSSWDVPLSKEMLEAVKSSGGEYEHRNTANRPIHTIVTTPEGSDYIRKTLEKWGETLPTQGQNDAWEGIISSFMHQPFGYRSSSKKTEDSIAVSFSVKDTSMVLKIPKEMIDPSSWEEMIELWDQRKSSPNAQAQPIILFTKDGESGHYLVKKDPKTGYWSRVPDPSVEDLVPRSPVPSRSKE